MTTDEELIDVRAACNRRLVEAAERRELSIDELDAAQQRLEEIMHRYYDGSIDADMAADAIEDLEGEVF